jgi:hypothetical protein
MRASAVAYFSGFLVVVVLHVSGLEKKRLILTCHIHNIRWNRRSMTIEKIPTVRICPVGNGNAWTFFIS